MREYQETKRALAQSKGFAEGAEAMREKLAAAFYNLGPGLLTGEEAAIWIRDMELP